MLKKIFAFEAKVTSLRENIVDVIPEILKMRLM